MDKKNNINLDHQIDPVAETQPNLNPVEVDGGDRINQDDVALRRKIYLGILGILVPALICVSVSFIRYLRQPEPLPDLLLPELNLHYPPHYLFSIYGVDKPVGLATTREGDRIYVAESGGDRFIRVFDRDGEPLGSIAPPKTDRGGRSPVYMATDDSGRLFVVDRLQHGVFIFDSEGRYLDTLIGPDTSLSERLTAQTETQLTGTTFAADLIMNLVYIQQAGREEQLVSLEDVPMWSPLGIRIDPSGHDLYLTDVSKDHNCVRIINISSMGGQARWLDFDPPLEEFGESGQAAGELLFPNTAVADSRGRIYVSDGNNGRISVWNPEREFLFHLGLGTGDGSLSLPRGLIVDHRDRLHIVDAVSQQVVVFDVSEKDPEFLFSFGGFGEGDGLFNFPNDIAIDRSGRLYIADRENNRIQIWSY